MGLGACLLSQSRLPCPRFPKDIDGGGQAAGAPWPGHPETNYSGIQRGQLASNTASLRLRAAALLLLQEMLASGELRLLLILLQEVCAGIVPG